MSEHNRRWNVIVEYEQGLRSRWWWEVIRDGNPGWPNVVGGGHTSTLSEAMDQIDLTIDLDLENADS